MTVLKFPTPRRREPTHKHAPYGDGSVWKAYAVVFALLVVAYVVAFVQFSGALR